MENFIFVEEYSDEKKFHFAHCIENLILQKEMWVKKIHSNRFLNSFFRITAGLISWNKV